MFDSKRPSGNRYVAPLAGKELSPWLARRLAGPGLMYARLPVSVTRRSANSLRGQRLLAVSRTAIIPLFRAAALAGKQTPFIPSSWKKLDLFWLKKRRKLNTYFYTAPEETAATPAPGEKPFAQKPFSSLKPGLSRSILKPAATSAGNPLNTSADSEQAEEIASQPASLDSGQIANTERSFSAADKKASKADENRVTRPAAGYPGFLGIPAAQRSMKSVTHQPLPPRTSAQPLRGLSRSEASPVIARSIPPAVKPATRPLPAAGQPPSAGNQVERPAGKPTTYQALSLKTIAQTQTGLSRSEASPVIAQSIPPAVKPATRPLPAAGKPPSAGNQVERPVVISKNPQPVTLKPVAKPRNHPCRSEKSLVIGRGKHSFQAKAPAPISLSTPVIKSGRPLISPVKRPGAYPASGTAAAAAPADAAPIFLSQPAVFVQNSGNLHDAAGRVISEKFTSVTALETEKPLASPGGLAKKPAPGVSRRLNLETGLPAADSDRGMRAPTLIERASAEKYDRLDIFEDATDQAFIAAETESVNSENRRSIPLILQNSQGKQPFTPLYSAANKPGRNLELGKSSPHKMSHPPDLHTLKTVGFVEDISGSLKANKTVAIKSGQKYHSSSGAKSTSSGLDLNRSPDNGTKTVDNAGAAGTERPARQNRAESGEKAKAPPIQVFTVRQPHSQRPVLPLSGNRQSLNIIKSEKPETSLLRNRVNSVYPEMTKPSNLKPLDLYLSSLNHPQAERDVATGRGIYHEQGGINNTAFLTPERAGSRRSFVSRAFVSEEIPLPPDSSATVAAVAATGAVGIENKTDLKALAREVYPYIKRMIIVDRERQPL